MGWGDLGTGPIQDGNKLSARVVLVAHNGIFIYLKGIGTAIIVALGLELRSGDAVSGWGANLRTFCAEFGTSIWAKLGQI